MLLLTASSAGAVANVFASQLRFDGEKISYLLNDDAEKVSVEVLDASGKVVYTHDLGAAKKGLNEFAVSDLKVDAGTYGWRLVAKGAPIAEATLFTSDKPEALNVTNIRGLGFDTWQESPAFGSFYAASAAGGATVRPGARTEAGIYAFNADLTAKSDNAYAGGQVWKGNSGPNNIRVAHDGQVFICDWTDGHAGIWIMNPEDPEADFTPVFGGGERASSGLLTVDGVKVAGSIQDFALYGEGENRMLYTTDEDINSNAGDIFVYAIGTLAKPWDTAPTACWGNNDGKIVNANQRVCSDGRGGIWVSQYRWEESAAYPVLSHANAAGVWDFQTGDKSLVLGSGPTAAAATNADGSLIAVADNGHGTNITVVKATYDENGLPTLAEFCKIDVTGYGNRPLGLAFDAANNVYAAFNNDGEQGGIAGWALPNDDNTYTTTANMPLTVSGVSTVINVIETENVYAEYFDITGRRIDTPEAGHLYIERRGTKVSKVIK